MNSEKKPRYSLVGQRISIHQLSILLKKRGKHYTTIKGVIYGE